MISQFSEAGKNVPDPEMSKTNGKKAKKRPAAEIKDGEGPAGDEPDPKKVKPMEGQHHPEHEGRSGGRKRKRKKRIFREITTQMEFYFSDANLSRSKFMKDKLKNSDDLVDLTTFLTFNKLAMMLRASFDRLEVEDLYLALKSTPSDLIKVVDGENGEKLVGRRQPMTSKTPESSEKCTVYVENLPPFATIDSLTNNFSKFGKVVYVSLPRYKANQAIKGFSFVEFENEESAQQCLKGEIQRLDPGKVNPEDLQTVKSYKKENEEAKSSSSESESESDTEKSKTEDQDDQKANENTDAKTEIKGDDQEDKKEVKKVKRRKKKSPFPLALDDNQLLAMFKIMSKTEWRRLRNKYLNLQKANMTKAKARLKHMKLPPPPPEESSKSKDVEFVKGVVVKFNHEEPVIDYGKHIKARIRAAVMEPVKYVDAENGRTFFHVRCANPKQAETIAGAKGIVGSLGQILVGEEETKYWEKLRNDRENKLSGNVKVPGNKKRGRDRLVKKHENAVSNTHRFFDDNDD